MGAVRRQVRELEMDTTTARRRALYGPVAAELSDNEVPRHFLPPITTKQIQLEKRRLNRTEMRVKMKG